MLTYDVTVIGECIFPRQCGIEASDPHQAIDIALTNLTTADYISTEYGDGNIAYVVDIKGDDDYSNSSCFNDANAVMYDLPERLLRWKQQQTGMIDHAMQIILADVLTYARSITPPMSEDLLK